MPGKVVNARVGVFGKLPAHGDFVRRGLPPVVTNRLDEWLQAGFGQSAHPSAAIAALDPLRFASSVVVDDELALGTMIATRDRVGRDYLVVALRLSSHPSRILPDAIPAVWDDWCSRAEALLIAARLGVWNRRRNAGGTRSRVPCCRGRTHRRGSVRSA